MEYKYNILEEVYHWMKSKEKNIEVRLLKEKSAMIQEGDFITFSVEDNPNKFIYVKVIKKELFSSIDDLLNTYDVNRMMPHHTNEELKELLNKIYKDNLINGKLVAFSFEYIKSDED